MDLMRRRVWIMSSYLYTYYMSNHKEEAVNIIESTTQAMQALEGDEWESITWTPYGIAKLINQLFQDLGSDKQIPPQMMYNYDRNGMIVRGQKNRKTYTAEEVGAFAVKYVSKHV